MIHIEFKKEEIEELNYERYNHPHPRIQKKCEIYFKWLKLGDFQKIESSRLIKNLISFYAHDEHDQHIV